MRFDLFSNGELWLFLSGGEFVFFFDGGKFGRLESYGGSFYVDIFLGCFLEGWGF